MAARQAATLDRLSNGRALFNLVTGGDPDELAGDGLHLSHAERYEASVEFTRIWRRVLEGETVDYAGKHIQVKGPSSSIRRCSSRVRRCTSAAPRRPPRTSPPSRSSCT